MNEDKSKKKDIKKEESVSSWSVESVEVIKENGVYKKEDKDLQDKIKKSLLKQKEKKKNKGENDDEDDENKDGDKNKDKDKDKNRDKDKDKNKNKDNEENDDKNRDKKHKEGDKKTKKVIGVTYGYQRKIISRRRQNLG